jgi:hypothetical protein
MILHINKNAFNNLSNGTYPIKVKFIDGYAEGDVEVKNKITFTILGKTFMATEGMTWGQWILSYNQGVSGNGIVWVSVSNDLYIDCRHDSNWSQGSPLGAPEDELYNSADVRQTLNTPIVAGMSYGRSSGAPT